MPGPRGQRCRHTSTGGSHPRLPPSPGFFPGLGGILRLSRTCRSPADVRAREADLGPGSAAAPGRGAGALAAVELPLHLNWSAPGRVFDLRSRADRARVYEIVLQEGTPADILAYVDGALLVDLWDDLVLPRGVRSAWAPLISLSSEAEA